MMERQASLKGNLEGARAWQRLTFPFPFVHQIQWNSREDSTGKGDHKRREEDHETAKEPSTK